MSAINTARIAKNTIYLYLRMVLILAANFYAVRILLEVLGVEDYGLFNLIVGFVTLFTLLNGAMMSTVQRFLCFEMGKAEGTQSLDTRLSTIFSISFYLFIALAVVILIVSETAGLWFVNCKLNIPAGREASALIVYQLSILVMIFKTMQIPYTALIVSRERMDAFARISIVEAVMTLGAALAIKWTGGDKLIVYTALYAVAIGVVMFTYAAYCLRYFSEARIRRVWDRTLIKELSGFFSWSIFGAVANMLKQQGLNVLINIFFGVAYNATWAVANKIGMAINQLVGNFQQAFNPQIVKSYAVEDKRPFYELLISSSKFSFLLLWFFALPLMLGCKFFLGLWLKGEMPPELVLFVDLGIVYMLFDALSGPLWMSVQATGRISKYQMQVSCLISSAFFLGLIASYFGASARIVMLINTLVNAVCWLYRIVFLKYHVGFPTIEYLKRTATPVVVVSVCGLVAAYLIRSMLMMDDVLMTLLAIGATVVLNTFFILFLGMTSAERRFALDKLRSKLKGAGK